ncbi:hypothetical protein ABXT44_05545 [Candidatus Pseudothioglobus sp. Uisw_041]|uniref:hypothetical protein n=1 Tax=Candidatus Pseudothioglobus sp. Uisw_041 TaxID=3230996 RepID=UPI003A8790DA
MKKILLILLLSFGLIGCSSINLSSLELSTTSPSVIEAEKILVLGLSHDQNLVEARKIANPNISLAVIKELNNRINEAEINRVDLENISKYAEMVKVSDDNLKFVGAKISDTKTRNMLGKEEKLDYFLLGSKDNNGFIQHKLNFSITYTSDERRNYSSASYCDKWNRCDNENQMDVILISLKASGCSSFDCDYNEIVEFELSDSFLKENMEEGFSIDFNSKGSMSSRVSISSSYIKGYLKIAN